MYRITYVYLQVEGLKTSPSIHLGPLATQQSRPGELSSQEYTYSKYQDYGFKFFQFPRFFNFSIFSIFLNFDTMGPTN